MDGVAKRRVFVEQPHDLQSLLEWIKAQIPEGIQAEFFGFSITICLDILLCVSILALFCGHLYFSGVSEVVNEEARSACFNAAVDDATEIFAKTKRSQQSVQSYTHILVSICDRAPTNLLVFSVGFDSHFYEKANRGGKSVFLEHSEEWTDAVLEDFPELDVLHVNYSTVLTDAKDIIDKEEFLWMELPPVVGGTDWDIIVIDGPPGHKKDDPGRMQSIYMTYILTNLKSNRRPTDIYLHDTDREVESSYGRKYLNLGLNASEWKKIGKTWYFRVGQPAS